MERRTVTGRLTFAWLRYLLVRHGWPALAGLVLMVAAALLQMAATPQLREREQALEEAQAELRSRLAARPQPVKDSGHRLVIALPDAAGTAAALAAVHLAASRHGVTLAQGEYRLARESGAPITRYQITLPARATYPQLRAWLADVLNGLPALALEEIALRRDDAATGVVEARLRLTLYVRRET